MKILVHENLGAFQQSFKQVHSSKCVQIGKGQTNLNKGGQKGLFCYVQMIYYSITRANVFSFYFLSQQLYPQTFLEDRLPISKNTGFRGSGMTSMYRDDFFQLSTKPSIPSLKIATPGQLPQTTLIMKDQKYVSLSLDPEPCSVPGPKDCLPFLSRGSHGGLNAFTLPITYKLPKRATWLGV